MAKIKKKLMWIVPWQYTQVVDTLERMEANGYRVKSIGNYIWTFEKSEPKQVRYAINYNPDANKLEPEPTESELLFQDMCEAAGWGFVGNHENMRIFRNENLQAVDLETDASMQVDFIHRSMKKNWLYVYWFLLLISVFYVFMNFLEPVIKNPLHFFTDGLAVFCAILWLSLLFGYAGELIAYYSWRRKAKRMAELENRLPRTKRGWYRFAILFFIGLDIVCLFNCETNIILWYFWTTVVVLVGSWMNYVLGTVRKKKGINASATSKAISIGIFLFLLVLMIGLTIWNTRNILADIKDEYENSNNVLPLRLEDFGYHTVNSHVDEDTSVFGSYSFVFLHNGEKKDNYIIVMETNLQLSEEEIQEAFQIIVKKAELG